MAESGWDAKFKSALDVQEPKTKAFFDKLISIRRQLRNFAAHGSFGKEGEAFSFHSGAGAVPVRLAHQTGHPRFSLSGERAFSEAEAIETIERFIAHLWSGPREPAFLYIQKSGLPIILTDAADGTYRSAMQSVKTCRHSSKSWSTSSTKPPTWIGELNSSAGSEQQQKSPPRKV